MFYETFRSLGPLMIPILSLLIPIVAIVAHYVSKTSNERQRHETIRELVRAGQPIPPELLDAPESEGQRARREQANPNRMLVPALINIAVGVGLMVMFYAMSPASWLWSIGLLPALIGLGLAVYWNVERKQLRPQP